MHKAIRNQKYENRLCLFLCQTFKCWTALLCTWVEYSNSQTLVVALLQTVESILFRTHSKYSCLCIFSQQFCSQENIMENCLHKWEGGIYQHFQYCVLSCGEKITGHLRAHYMESRWRNVMDAHHIAVRGKKLAHTSRASCMAGSYTHRTE